MGSFQPLGSGDHSHSCMCRWTANFACPAFGQFSIVPHGHISTRKQNVYIVSLHVVRVNGQSSVQGVRNGPG